MNKPDRVILGRLARPNLRLVVFDHLSVVHQLFPPDQLEVAVQVAEDYGRRLAWLPAAEHIGVGDQLLSQSIAEF